MTQLSAAIVPPPSLAQTPCPPARTASRRHDAGGLWIARTVRGRTDHVSDVPPWRRLARCVELHRQKAGDRVPSIQMTSRSRRRRNRHGGEVMKTASAAHSMFLEDQWTPRGRLCCGPRHNISLQYLLHRFGRNDDDVTQQVPPHNYINGSIDAATGLE